MSFMAGLGQGLGAGGGNLLGTILTNEFNRKEASKNRRFQYHMSATAYQRSVSDLMKAGLNPMLAYMSGPAGSGGGSQASGEDMGGAVSTGLQAARLKADLDLIKKQGKKLEAETAESATRAAYNVTSGKALEDQRAKDRATRPAYEVMESVLKKGKQKIHDSGTGKKIERLQEAQKSFWPKLWNDIQKLRNRGK